MNTQQNLLYIQFPLLGTVPWLKHGFSTRLGGISQEAFFSNNLGLHVGDLADNVMENRKRFCQASGVNYLDLVAAEQVHGNNVVIAKREHLGCGNALTSLIPQTDAIITDQVRIPLITFYADCVPVAIVDVQKRVIAVVHAGWRGTKLNIVAKVLSEMHRAFGSSLLDCLAVIGPSIGPCCYEVSEVVRSEFCADSSDAENYFTLNKNGKFQLDLWKVNRTQLLQAGVKPVNLAVSGICTSCQHKLFYSYRKENGLTGRMGLLLMRDY